MNKFGDYSIQATIQYLNAGLEAVSIGGICLSIDNSGDGYSEIVSSASL